MTILIALLPMLLQLGYYVIKFIFAAKSISQQMADQQWQLDMQKFWDAVDKARELMLSQAQQDSQQAQDVENQIDSQPKPTPLPPVNPVSPVPDQPAAPPATQSTQNVEDVIDQAQKKMRAPRKKR